jgi:hypothetical protein
MLKFDPYYFQCPSCHAWLEGRNLKAELVNEAILYSDGKVLYDNYITTRQKMLICPSCAHTFWIENPVEPIVTTQKPDADVYSWSTWRFYGISFSNIRGKLALIKHYQVFLKKRNYDAIKEIYLRRLLWWAYNDLRRNHQQIRIKYFLNGFMSFNVWRLNRRMLIQGEAFFIKNREGFAQNLKRLLVLLEKHPEERADLEMPEIYRELRQFDKAKALLENTRSRTHFTNQLLRYCKWKESRVFMVTG